MQAGPPLTWTGGDDSVLAPSGAGTRRTGPTEIELTVAFAVSFVMAFRLRLPPDIPIGYFIAGALLPVSAMALRRYRGMLPIAVLTAAAVVNGLFLNAAAKPLHSIDRSLTEIHTARVLGIALATMALLWARSIIGTRNTVFMYGLGMFASLGLAGINEANPWKFSFSVPVVLVVMSLPMVYRRRAVESVLLLALATYSALNDSRSAAATLLIAAVLVMIQRRGWRARPVSRARATRILLRIAAVALVAFFVLQFAIVRGLLGAEVQARTIEQINTSGSVILGGRAEAGASVKLLKEQPWGYGSGTLPNHHDVQVGKEGLQRVGADPDSPAKIEYLFGRGFEVHSVIGDLWILFGVAGLALAVAVGLYLLYGIARTTGERVASGVMLYLAVRSVWDLPFSPLLSAMYTLPLALAVVLPVVTPDTSRAARLRLRRRRPVSVPVRQST